MTRRRVLALALLGSLAASAPPVAATEVRFFRQQTRADFAAGEFDGLALDGDGALRPAARFESLASLDEPYVYVAAATADGWTLGTGSAGRVVAVSRSGETATVATVEEPEIFALWADADGAVFFGSSPGGKVYAVEDGSVREVFDPEETYIWAIARAPWGELLVATGDAARLYALGADGEARLLYDSDEAHLRALHPLADRVLIGTVGDGLVLTVDADGRIRTLYDAEQDEVLAFAADGSGGWYAAAVASDASFTQQARDKAKAGATASEDGEPEVIVEVTPTADAVESGGTRSEILRGAASGDVRSAATLARETVYSLGWVDGRLWIGTGAEGNVYSLVGGRLALEAGLDDRQVVGIFGEPTPVIVTTNAAAVHRAAAGAAGSGSYVSDALDAGGISRFGALRWHGAAADEDGVRFQVRIGASSKPDATWSEWTPATAGRELALAAVPPGRFVQWRLEIAAPAGATRVSGVELSYRQNNGEPMIRDFTAMDPGQVLVPASFNPGDQVYEPVNPSREGIFTTLAPESPAANGRLKALWRIGFLTLRWEVEDPNDDGLVFDLAFRRDDAAGPWLTMVEDLAESYYSFDATVLPDGIHRFRLRASDRPGNTADTALTAEEISPPIVVDHSPPRLVSAVRRDGRIEVTIADALSPIRRAEVSVDAAEWQQVVAADGLLDGRREVLRVDVPEAAGLVLLRVMDAAFNGATFDLLEESP